EREEPIAADAREQGDSKEIAKQKVMASAWALTRSAAGGTGAKATQQVLGSTRGGFSRARGRQRAAARAMLCSNSRPTRHSSMPRSAAQGLVTTEAYHGNADSGGGEKLRSTP